MTDIIYNHQAYGLLFLSPNIKVGIYHSSQVGILSQYEGFTVPCVSQPFYTGHEKG